ncbi:MAG: phage tail fiber protein [Cetobacterium sp.]|uniref:phage tail fiber protein n=1 Tax=Cetobacterium sp. TaxID=2071632 RepID=UPI003F31CD45
MAGFTNYGENLVINTVLRGSTKLYVGLLLGDPTESGSYTNEIKTPSYSRKIVSFIEPSTGETYNDDDITFDTALENWGWVTHIGIFDSPTNGNMITYAALDFKKEIRAADIYKIPRGFFLFDLD